MPFIFPPDQRYDCQSCTRCCRGAWNIHVDPGSYERVHGSPLYQALERAHGEPPMVLTEIDSNRTVLSLLKEGGCVFLDDDNLCSIHRDMGEQAKPFGCRLFPFVLRPTPDGVVVGVSFFCSAVQRNEGRLLSEHTELEAMLGEYRHPSVGSLALPLFNHITISWKSYRILEDLALTCIAGPDLGKGLWQILLGTGLTALCLLENPPPGPRIASALVPTASDEELHHRLSTMPVICVEPDDVFDSLERMFVIGALGALESPPELCKANTDAIFERGIVDSEIFRRRVDLAGFDAWRATLDTAWSEPHFQRYLNHLVWRKFLVGSSNIVSNAAALYLALPLLAWYRDLSAYLEGRPAPVIEDVYLAFSVLERGFTTHSRAMYPLFEEMGRVFVQQLRKIAAGRLAPPTAEASS